MKEKIEIVEACREETIFDSYRERTRQRCRARAPKFEATLEEMTWQDHLALAIAGALTAIDPDPRTPAESLKRAHVERALMFLVYTTGQDFAVVDTEEGTEIRWRERESALKK